MESSVLERIQDLCQAVRGRTAPGGAHRPVPRHLRAPLERSRTSTTPFPTTGPSRPTTRSPGSLAVYETSLAATRVELVPRLAPAAAGALRRAGFNDEGVLPLMACNADDFLGRRPAAGDRDRPALQTRRSTGRSSRCATRRSESRADRRPRDAGRARAQRAKADSLRSRSRLRAARPSHRVPVSSLTVA